MTGLNPHKDASWADVETAVRERAKADAAGGDEVLAAFVAAFDRQRAEIERLKSALRDAARTDKSYYRHHEPRHFDGKSPKAAGGTIWRTPREIARRVLGEPDLATTAEYLGDSQ